MDSSVVLDDNRVQSEIESDLTQSELPRDPKETEVQYANSPEELREQSMLELQRNSRLSEIYGSQIYKDAKAELTKLALSSSQSKLSSETRSKASEIIIELGKHFSELTRDEQFELYQDFEKAHTEARKEALLVNIEALAEKHATKLTDSATVSTELQSLVSTYSDVLGKNSDIKAQIEKVYSTRFQKISETQEETQRKNQERLARQSKKELMDHITESAEAQALRYFRVNPGKKIPESTVNHHIKVLLERHSAALPKDDVARERFIRQVYKKYYDNYNRVHRKEFSKLGILKRAYYGTTGLIRDAYRGITSTIKSIAKKIVNTVTKTGEALKKGYEALKEAKKALGEVVDSAIKKVGEVIDGTMEALDELGKALSELRDSAVKAVVDTAMYIKDTTVKVVKTTVKAIGNTIYNIATFDYTKLPEMLSRGWKATKEAFNAVLDVGKDILNSVNEARKYIGKKIGEFAYSAYEACTYENFCKVCSSINEARKYIGKKIGEFAYSAYEACTYENFCKVCSSIKKGVIATVDGLNKARLYVGKKIGEFAYSAYEACTYENFMKVCTSVVNTLDKLDKMVMDGLKALANPKNWVKAATTAINAITKTVEFAAFAIKNPRAAFNVIKNGINTALEYAAPVLDFLHGLGKELGINDILYGAYSLVKTPFQLAYDIGKTGTDFIVGMGKVMSGKMTAKEFGAQFKKNIKSIGKNLIENIKNSTLIVKGATRLLFECSGVSDLFYMTKYLIEGNYAMAAMHGAFAVGTIASVAGAIFTGGASLTGLAGIQSAKAAMKTAAKKLVGEVTVSLSKSFGKELGEAAFSKVCKTLGKEVTEKGASQEVVEKAGKEILEKQSREAAIKTADESIVKMNQLVQKEGIQKLNAETTEELVEKLAKEHGDLLYKELGIEQAAKETAQEFLENVSKMSVRDIQKELLKTGMSKSQARTFARKYYKVIQKGGSDDILEKALVEQIEKPFKEMIEKDAKVFADRFKKLLLNDADELAKVANKEVREAAQQLNKALREEYGEKFSKVVDDLTEAAQKGFKKGRGKALREAVERGVRKAIRDFRSKRGKPKPNAKSNNKEAEKFETEIDELKINEPEELVQQNVEEAKVASMDHDPSEVRYRMITIDGQQFRQKFEKSTLASGSEQWTLTSVEVVGNVEEAKVSLAVSNERGTTLRKSNSKDYSLSA